MFQPLVSFIYGLVIGSITSESYIKMMEYEAIQAEQEFKTNGRIRVIVQDNGSIHKSLEVQEYWTKWESLGLYIFFLPTYCSEMNKIELEWQQLKKHKISGQMFDDEIDLAYAVIDGIDARGERNNYRTERFKFNYHPFS